MVAGIPRCNLFGGCLGAQDGWSYQSGHSDHDIAVKTAGDHGNHSGYLFVMLLCGLCVADLGELMGCRRHNHLIETIKKKEGGLNNEE